MRDRKHLHDIKKFKQSLKDERQKQKAKSSHKHEYDTSEKDNKELTHEQHKDKKTMVTY